MRAETVDLIERFKVATWFPNVGKQIVEPQITQVHSWESAVAFCTSERWQDLQLETSNMISAAVAKNIGARAPRAFGKKWNQAVKELQAVLRPLVEERTNALMLAHGLPKAFRDSVRWDVLNACLEMEFEDMAEGAAFFSGLARWYIKGHFPCGWDGEFPHGKLVVY